MQKFSEVPYQRPDMVQFKKDYRELVNVFENAESFEQAKEIFFELQEMESSLYTTYTIASIRNTMDTTDKFYEKEIAFFNKELPKLISIQKKYLKVLLKNRYREQMEAEFGPHLFKDAEVEQRVQSTKIVQDLVKEANLSTDYQKTVATCKTNFRGEECNFYGLLKHMESPDREERKEAFHAWAKMYEETAPTLDDLYDKLVAVRVTMAKKLDFENYIPLAYLGKHRMDYTSKEVEKFREQVLKVIVPACAKLRELQAKRIGVEKLKYYDEMFMFPDGNPDPIGNKDQMVAWAKEMYQELSSETAEFFNFMVEHELFDLETRPGKHMGGYCTSLSEYKAPFIFSNFNGTSADVDVLTHEAGHAFESYTTARCQKIAAYRHSTSEINEIHSMSMEHFTYPWMDKFFGENAEKYRYAHLCSALLVIPYMMCVDEFQHRVFVNPTMTADERRSVWHEIEQKYMPWRDYDGVDYMEKGGFWMQKQHIFLYPFYYIDYALAQIGAFEFYSKMKKDQNEAWNDYLKLCRAGGSTGYFELLKIANLSNPFEEGSVEKAVSSILKEIEESKFSEV
ncbi:MAG: oligoendopeptidase family [Herbinix sp.]|jgi:M3 family oligoendopeptidase|nr:oligoendopeptidase family [Herbinix sp.]